MNFADKKTRLYGLAGAVAALAVLYTWVLQPLGAKWADLGQQLEPKQAQVDQFREQVYGHEALIAKRESLVKRMGSLLGPQAKDAKQEGTDKASGKKEAPPATAPSNQPPDGTPQGGKPATEKPAEPSPTPPSDAKPQEAAKQPGSEAAKPVAAAEASAAPKEAAVAVNPATATPTPPNAPDKSAAPKPESGETSAKPAPSAEADQNKPSGEKSPAKDAAGSQQSSDRRLATYFDKTATQSGLKIKRVTVKKASGGPKGAKSFVPVALQINVEGNAESLMKFLYQVEKGDRFARVDQLEIHRDAAKGNSLDANLDVSGYQE